MRPLRAICHHHRLHQNLNLNIPVSSFHFQSPPQSPQEGRKEDQKTLLHYPRPSRAVSQCKPYTVYHKTLIVSFETLGWGMDPEKLLPILPEVSTRSLAQMTHSGKISSPIVKNRLQMRHAPVEVNRTIRTGTSESELWGSSLVFIKATDTLIDIWPWVVLLLLVVFVESGFGPYPATL